MVMTKNLAHDRQAAWHRVAVIALVLPVTLIWPDDRGEREGPAHMAGPGVRRRRGGVHKLLRSLS